MPSARMLAKQANVPLKVKKREAMEQILRLGLLSFGGGVAARSLMGLRDMLTPKPEAQFISPGPSVLQIPTKEEEEGEDAAPPVARPFGLPKAAADPSPVAPAAPAAPQLPFISQVAAKLAPLLPDKYMGGALDSDSLSSMSNHPWAAVGAVGMGLGGAAGGYALTDWLLKKKRKADRDAELAAAEKEYRDAMNGTSKTASAPYTGLEELCKLATNMADVAAWPQTLLYLSMAGLGGASAYGMYNYQKSRGQAALLAKALKARRRKLWEASPQPIYAVPAGTTDEEAPLP